MTREPTHGWTALGHAVHARTIDHLPSGTAVQRFNAHVAVAVTQWVGSMGMAYAFTVLALISAPAAFASGSLLIIVAWVAQTFLQLVLLPVIMVGQSVQSAASDARAAKTFEDAERILDALSLQTEGGLKAVLDAIEKRLPTA